MRRKKGGRRGQGEERKEREREGREEGRPKVKGASCYKSDVITKVEASSTCWK